MYKEAFMNEIKKEKENEGKNNNMKYEKHKKDRSKEDLDDYIFLEQDNKKCSEK